MSALAGDTLARDLARHYRELDQQEADQEFRDLIEGELEEIRELVKILTFENILKARSHAQYVIDYCSKRLLRRNEVC